MNKLFISLITLAISAQALALPVSPAAVEWTMNHSGPKAAQVQLGTLLTRNKVHVIRATYDFAVQGGAIGSVNLKDFDGNAAKLPLGAIIKQVLIDVVTAPTSGGAATIALTAQSAGDLKAATAIASYTGLVAGVPVGSAATMIKLTAERTISATIATAALTGGKINVLIEYYLTK
jgi:hypothetical protein